jgi:hypothetical protein
MSTPEPVPQQENGHDGTVARGVCPAARCRSAAAARGPASEVERLRARLAAMPDERWTRGFDGV